jgi:hypothetical protein
MIKHVGGLGSQGFGVAGDCCERCFDRLFAELLGTALDALADKLGRVRGRIAGASALVHDCGKVGECEIGHGRVFFRQLSRRTGTPKALIYSLAPPIVKVPK